MDSSAIKQIQESHAASQLNETVAGHNTVAPLVALPSGFDIESLEAHMPNRSRFRGCFSTSMMDDFAAYAKQHNQDSSSCFVEGNLMRASIFFDLGNVRKPGHCSHKAIMEVERLCDYSALLRVDGDTFTQKTFAEWVEDWRDNITMLDSNGGEIETGLAVAAIRLLTIQSMQSSTHTDGDLRSSRSALEEIEADGGDNLPHSFSFRCKPYECIDFREFVVRVSVLTSHEKPQFSLRVIQLELHKEEIAKEFAGLVKDSLEGSEITTYMGSFSS